MTDSPKIERITRSLAFMLRHQPGKFDLEVDAHGFAEVDEVVRALNERLGEPVEAEEVQEAVKSGDRRRYEVQGSKIRALYGHSIPVEPGSAARPPEMLYVAIPERDAERAARFGLRGGRRRFLHLALNVDDARETGRRAAREYSVLSIRALDAWEEGVNFYDRVSLWLAEEVPTHLIAVEGTFDDGTDPEHRYQRHGGRRGEGRRGDGRRPDRHGGRGRERRDERRDDGDRPTRGRRSERDRGREPRDRDRDRARPAAAERTAEIPRPRDGERGRSGGRERDGDRGRDRRRERNDGGPREERRPQPRSEERTVTATSEPKPAKNPRSARPSAPAQPFGRGILDESEPTPPPVEEVAAPPVETPVEEPVRDEPPAQAENDSSSSFGAGL